MSTLFADKATDKQIEFITRLGNERDLTAEETYLLFGGIGRLSKKGASATIDKLLAKPYKNATPAPTTALWAKIPAKVEYAAGGYRDSDGNIIRVYLGQNSGTMLASRWDGSGFTYVGSASRLTLTPMSKDDVQLWGRNTGTCLICGRRLDVPESVDRGIGPVCWSKMGY